MQIRIASWIGRPPITLSAGASRTPPIPPKPRKPITTDGTARFKLSARIAGKLFKPETRRNVGLLGPKELPPEQSDVPSSFRLEQLSCNSGAQLESRCAVGCDRLSRLRWDRGCSACARTECDRRPSDPRSDPDLHVGLCGFGRRRDRDVSPKQLYPRTDVAGAYGGRLPRCSSRSRCCCTDRAVPPPGIDR